MLISNVYINFPFRAELNIVRKGNGSKIFTAGERIAVDRTDRIGERNRVHFAELERVRADDGYTVRDYECFGSCERVKTEFNAAFSALSVIFIENAVLYIKRLRIGGSSVRTSADLDVFKHPATNHCVISD